VPLRARDLGAVQAAADADLDPLRAEAESRLHGLLHRAAEGDAALELRGDVLGHELRVELRTLDLLDVDVDLTVDELLQLVAELVDLGTLASDDDSRARRVDVDAHLVRRALDVDLRDSGVGEALLQILAKLQITMQRLGVALAGEPAGVPRLVESEPKSVRVDLLTQDSPLFPSAGTASLGRTFPRIDRFDFVRNVNRHVSLPLLNAVGAAHRSRLHALLTRSFVDIDLRDHQVVGVDVRL